MTRSRARELLKNLENTKREVVCSDIEEAKQECPICLEKYVDDTLKQKIILHDTTPSSSEHAVCLNCANTLVANSQWTICPLCRGPITKEDGYVTKNYNQIMGINTNPEVVQMNAIARERGSVQDSQQYNWDGILDSLYQAIVRREMVVRRGYLDLGRADDGLLGRIEYNLFMLNKARDHFRQLSGDVMRRERFLNAMIDEDRNTASIRVLVLNEQLRTIYRMIEEIVYNTNSDVSRFVKKLDLLERVVHQDKSWREFLFNMKCRLRDFLISILTPSRPISRQRTDIASGIIKKKQKKRRSKKKKHNTKHKRKSRRKLKSRRKSKSRRKRKSRRKLKSTRKLKSRHKLKIRRRR